MPIHRSPVRRQRTPASPWLKSRPLGGFEPLLESDDLDLETTLEPYRILAADFISRIDGAISPTLHIGVASLAPGRL
jgi:hypothetical protein